MKSMFMAYSVGEPVTSVRSRRSAPRSAAGAGARQHTEMPHGSDSQPSGLATSYRGVRSAARPRELEPPRARSQDWQSIRRALNEIAYFQANQRQIGRLNMDECCKSPKGRSPASRRQACPECGVAGIAVGEPTIAHHLSTPASWTPSAARHFFCASPTCDTVYFGDDGSRITRDRLHTRVGIKDRSEEHTSELQSRP